MKPTRPPITLDNVIAWAIVLLLFAILPALSLTLRFTREPVTIKPILNVPEQLPPPPRY